MRPLGRSLVVWLQLLLALSFVVLPGCAVTLVPEYDQATEEKLIATYESVNRLYDSLAEADPAARAYEGYSKAWADVATDLRVLAMRQKARPDNEESQKIIDKLLSNWETARALHKKRSSQPEHRDNPYLDSQIELDRTQFEAQFSAAVAAEVFKK